MTYARDTEFEDFSVVGLFHVFDFPGSGGVVADRALLGELHVAELPFGRGLRLVREVDVDCAAFLDVYFAKVELVHRVVVLRREVGEDLYLRP